ncbi:hypothetical protein LSTR_LSTR008736 [Laodelphax striatellus]|uniref:Uncharacterized protein n=1 Tax=Laodelphax striatellus TaxID=195883 RepID=A0A482XPW6_LAOST|nr:hypothetical protein LSTR_LSTR008736 [Laodelphax striatellus]
MTELKMIPIVTFVTTILIGQAISSPLFDTGRRYSDLDEIAIKCRKICRANNGEVQINGDECRCRFRTDNPVESVDHVLKRAGREGLNLVPRIYPRFRRSPCLGVLGMPVMKSNNPRLGQMQQRLRAYGVGMLAPILGISPEQVNVLVGDIMKGNYRQPLVIGQPALGKAPIGQEAPDTTRLDVADNIPLATNLGATSVDNVPLATNLGATSVDNISLATNVAAATPVDNIDTSNQYQNSFVGSMIERVPDNKETSNMAIDGEPMLGLQRSIVSVPIVGGSQVPSSPVVNNGVLAVDGPIVSPFKTRRFTQRIR